MSNFPSPPDLVQDKWSDNLTSAAFDDEHAVAIVGRFRSDHEVNYRATSLEHWRVTTRDPDIARCLAESLHGSAPQKWSTSDADIYETFTTASSVDVILDDPRAICSEMIMWGPTVACVPHVTVWFRLATCPDIGKFRFTSDSWDLAKDIAGPERELALIDGPARARLELEPVTYTRAGQRLRTVKPVLTLLN